MLSKPSSEPIWLAGYLQCEPKFTISILDDSCFIGECLADDCNGCLTLMIEATAAVFACLCYTIYQ